MSIKNGEIATFEALGRVVAQAEVAAEKLAETFRERSRALVATLPRKEGKFDRDAPAFKPAREDFKRGYRNAKASYYDLPLLRSGANLFTIPTGEEKSNYTLTGAAALDLDADTLPASLAFFVRDIKAHMSSNVDRAWSVLLSNTLKAEAADAARAEKIARNNAMLTKGETPPTDSNTRTGVDTHKKIEQARKAVEGKRAKANQLEVGTKDALARAFDIADAVLHKKDRKVIDAAIAALEAELDKK